jgi:hypothetical protein
LLHRWPVFQCYCGQSPLWHYRLFVPVKLAVFLTTLGQVPSSTAKTSSNPLFTSAQALIVPATRVRTATAQPPHTQPSKKQAQCSTMRTL